MKEKQRKNSWGGPWTETKLRTFGKYVWSYLKIFKAHPHWKTIYFDGFAGSGNRSYPETSLYKQLSLSNEEVNLYKGAAERVLLLEDDLVFDYYYFVDKETELRHLKAKLEPLPNARRSKLEFRKGDCNQWLAELAKALRTDKYAALILLDPFGMQVNWDSIANLKGTRSDIWILVPTGVIVNRLLDRSGKLKHMDKLVSFFGLSEEEIKAKFYSVNPSPTLFGEEDEIVTKIIDPINHIMNIYIQQLKTIWAFVTEPALRLNNTKGRPLFHLVFASNNKTALKIAKEIIAK